MGYEDDELFDDNYCLDCTAIMIGSSFSLVIP